MDFESVFGAKATGGGGGGGGGSLNSDGEDIHVSHLHKRFLSRLDTVNWSLQMNELKASLAQRRALCLTQN